MGSAAVAFQAPNRLSEFDVSVEFRFVMAVISSVASGVDVNALSRPSVSVPWSVPFSSGPSGALRTQPGSRNNRRH